MDAAQIGHRMALQALAAAVSDVRTALERAEKLLLGLAGAVENALMQGASDEEICECLRGLLTGQAHPPSAACTASSADGTNEI